ncbi:MAG: D-alanyl-D-alanine carboxypeptidase/D-alanyl-D-alanine-endopeptidase [candidate division KSB1 bacterium]|nr:D-alanyl-D-alanine carboxypeptidase/D-alanyl-D-alanine-endopeptidase [candidate division KSB1 bacterium]
MVVKKLLLLLAAAFCLAQAADLDRNISAKDAKSPQNLSARLDSLFNLPALRHSFVGAAVFSPSKNDFIYRYNELKAFLPASTMKLFTTAAALQILGHDFRFQTRIFMRGRTGAGVFTGDIILKGDGDPTLTWHEGMSDSASFNRFAAMLKRRGVKEIRGRLIGDDSVFDDQILGWGWGWENELQAYSAPIGGLTINRNCVGVIVTPGNRAGELCTVRLSPGIRNGSIENRCTTVDDDKAAGLYVERQRGSDRILVSGSLRASYPAEQRTLPVGNPTLYALQVLRRALESKGIQVNSELVDLDDLPGYTYPLYAPVFVHVSEPLKDIVRDINKNSNNLAAEALFKAVGFAVFGIGSAESGASAIEKWAKQNNIPMEGNSIVDGSGLSRKSAVTPISFIKLLHVMQSDSAFYASLPIAGQDGTLAHRMRDTLCRGRIRAKTGTLEGVMALSGYAEAVSGDTLIFCITVNQAPAARGSVYDIMNRFCLNIVKQ